MVVPRALRKAGVAFFCAALLTLLCLVWPFQPYRQLEFVSVPQEVCPGQPIQTEVARAVEDPLLGRLRGASVISTWTEVNTGHTESQGPTPIALYSTDGEVISSPVLRTAPTEPGEWMLSSVTTASGFVGYMPRHPKTTMYAPNTTVVKEPGSEGCSSPGVPLGGDNA